MNYLVPALLLGACFQLAADVTIERKKEGKESGLILTKIKGNRARIDTQGAMGSITVLIDNSGKLTTYVHQSKLALTTAATDSQKAARELVAKAGAAAAKPDPFTKTGETEKVGDWTCEVWVRHTPSVTHKEWRTRELANFDRIQQQLALLTSVPGMDLGSVAPSGAFIAKTETSDAQGTTSVTVTRTSEEILPESAFAPPAGYREMTVPAQ